MILCDFNVNTFNYVKNNAVRLLESCDATFLSDICLRPLWIQGKDGGEYGHKVAVKSVKICIICHQDD